LPRRNEATSKDSNQTTLSCQYFILKKLLILLIALTGFAGQRSAVITKAPLSVNSFFKKNSSGGKVLI